MKNILFIPFSDREGALPLYLRAIDWQRCYINHKQLDQSPIIYIYRREDELAVDYERYEDAPFKFNPDDLEPNSKIYIMGDFLGSSTFISNVNEHYKNWPNFVLPIELVAIRLKEMGFTPELAEKIKALKLYVCGDDTGANNGLASKLERIESGIRSCPN